MTASQDAAAGAPAAPVTVTRDGHVLTLELNRPPANFFTAEMVETIVAELASAAEAGARVAVLVSTGKHFCAGADLAGGSSGSGLDSRLYDAAAHLFESPLPVVAAVQGAAVGGGLGLALAADFRVATPETRFTANFARLGFHHGFGLTVSLPYVVGSQFALEMLATGRNVYGEEAARVRLCDRLVPVEELRAEAYRFASGLAEAAPLSVRAIRATMAQGLADRVREATAHELQQQRELARTADFKEGLRASRDRRTPKFTGE